ncbi:MAG: ATP-binding protein [Actinomycetota bacterium]
MRFARRESTASAGEAEESAQPEPQGERRASRATHLRAVSPAERLRSLEDVERGRWHLWSTTFVLLFALSLAIAVMSYWRDALPESIAQILDYSSIRFVFVLLSFAFTIYVVDRERRFRKVTHALIDTRARSLALEDRLREVSALQQVLAAVNSSLQLDQVLEIILRHSSRLVTATEGAVLLLDPEEGVLTVASALPSDLTGTFPIGDDLPGTVARTRLATLVPTPEDVARYPWLAGRNVTSSMCAPLVAGGQLIGTLILSTTEDRYFGEYDLRLLMLFAEQAAVAINNAQAFTREQESVSRLADLDRLKTDFIATTTHELKTPLTSLMGYAQILRKRSADLAPEQREEFFNIMARQGEKILRLIEELLQSSRIEAGASKLRREPLDLRSIAKDVESGLSGLAKTHTLHFDVPEGDLGLFGDPTALEHVFTNLLENALKYSEPGTEIRLTVEEDESEVMIKITDQGQGIDPEDLPHIFERFRQSNGKGRTRNSVGLGLYIVRSLVNAHGGRVWADSQLGKGTTFTIALPRRAEQERLELQDAEQSSRLLDQVTEVP